mmetsp:Transcript_19836/g.56807  ORF Transcript_19836/g.56807 Transcript_19836/m.56807 type:complete len:214 (-) Transcript_19836:207-848(-)
MRACHGSVRGWRGAAPARRSPHPPKRRWARGPFSLPARRIAFGTTHTPPSCARPKHGTAPSIHRGSPTTSSSRWPTAPHGRPCRGTDHARSARCGGTRPSHKRSALRACAYHPPGGCRNRPGQPPRTWARKDLRRCARRRSTPAPPSTKLSTHGPLPCRRRSACKPRTPGAGGGDRREACLRGQWRRGASPERPPCGPPPAPADASRRRVRKA